MIKCSLCSYQYDNWYARKSSTSVHKIIIGGSAHKACLVPWPRCANFALTLVAAYPSGQIEERARFILRNACICRLQENRTYWMGFKLRFTLRIQRKCLRGSCYAKQVTLARFLLRSIYSGDVQHRWEAKRIWCKIIRPLVYGAVFGVYGASSDGVYVL